MSLHFVGVGSVGGLFAFFTQRALRVEASQVYRSSLSPGRLGGETTQANPIRTFADSSVTLHMHRPLPTSALAADGSAILTRETFQGEVQREGGLHVEQALSTSTSPIDVLVIALKSDMTLKVVGPLVQRFRRVDDPRGPSTVVFLQNGVGNDQQFLEHFFPQNQGRAPSGASSESQGVSSTPSIDSPIARPFVLLSSNSHGTSRKESLWVRHMGYNAFHFGVPPDTAERVGGEEALLRFSANSSQSALPPPGTQTLYDLIQVLGSETLRSPSVAQCTLEPWSRLSLRALQKLVVNCCANAIGAVYDCQNGEVLDRPELNQLRKDVTAECARVLRAKWAAEYAPATTSDRASDAQVPPEIEESTLHDVVYALIDRNRINRVSMLQDIYSGRGATEVDLINGTVVRWGRAYGVPTPLNEQLMGQVQERARQSRR